MIELRRVKTSGGQFAGLLWYLLEGSHMVAQSLGSKGLQMDGV